MVRLVICVLLCVGSVVLGDKHDKYEGHQLYRIAGEVQTIHSLDDRLDILTSTPAARSASGKLEALVRLSPEEKAQWLQYFDSYDIAYTKIADNLAEILRQEEAEIQRKRTSAREDSESEESKSDENESEESKSEEGESEEGDSEEGASEEDESISWDTYYRHEEINNFLDKLGAEYPDTVTVINAGLSYEGRQIKYVRISSTRFENLYKPVIIIDAMVHAREWVTTPVAMYIIQQLVVDIADSRLSDEIDWLIIPLANPDGYEYTIDEDRLWRKTRSLSHPGADECPGVDGNRNFAHHWGTTASAANPCALTYEGPSAFSESETRIIQSAVLAHVGRTALYISLHSHGNMFLYSWGNNGTLPANGLILHLAGVTMATAIDALALDKADRYIVGNAANVLYFSTGTSRDWTRSVGIPLTYTLELPGYEYGFVVPPTYVEQIVKETWAGIAAGARYVLSTW